MSEYGFDSHGAESASEFASESLMLAECPPARSMPVPFELESREAEALRGALSFLFSLITFYDELVALEATTSEFASCGDGCTH